jgi:cell division protease FtsH
MLERISGLIARRWRALLVWLFITGAFLFWFLPNIQALFPYVILIFTVLFQLAFAILFMVVQFGALFYFLSRGRTYWILPGETGISFKDYRGQKDILEVSQRIVTLLRGVKEFKRMGGEVSKGLMLVGPPGTGKSYLAQAIATEAGVPFGYASGTSFQQMFMGMGNLTVWRLYAKARKLARQHGACILMIDEIDAVGMRRGGGGGGMGMMGGMFGGGGMGLLNEILMQMDPPRVDGGWKERLLRRLGLRRGATVLPTVFTMAATNMPEVLDPALLRPGRFDRKITIDPPDLDGRKDIIEYYLEKVRHEEIPVDRMASDTVGYTPVSIKYVINEAVVVAHFKGRDAITYEDISEAREIHEWGLRQPIHSMKLLDKRRIAYHEAGHAFAQATLLPRERLAKVTIVRHGRALGLSASKPQDEYYTYTKEELLGQIKSALASRAAEELFLHTAMTGAGQDLQQATQMAIAYYSVLGMGDSLYSIMGEGPSFAGPSAQRDRIEQLLDEQYAQVKMLLWTNADVIHEMARRLVSESELTGDDVEEIIKEKQAERTKLLTDGVSANGASAAGDSAEERERLELAEQKRRAAYHEAGHAIARAKLQPMRATHKVSIVPTADGSAGGFGDTPSIADSHAGALTRNEIFTEISVALGGRAAEVLFLDEALSGSSSDLAYATRLAGSTITQFGMNGSLYVYESARSVRDPVVKQEVEKVLNERFEKVQGLLAEHKVEIEQIVNLLRQRETINAEDVEAILEGRDPPLNDARGHNIEEADRREVMPVAVGAGAESGSSGGDANGTGAAGSAIPGT